MARERAFGYSYSQILNVPGPQEVSVNATITVYLTGTLTLATIYSDSGGTAKSNPFASDTNGYWFFYADDGTYDVALSGGTPTIGPYTLAGIQLLTSGGGGGGGSFSAITSGTNTSAAMVVGTGASLSASGSGTIHATSADTATVASAVPFSGVTPGTNTGALIVGSGGSIRATGTGAIDATNVPFFDITAYGARAVSGSSPFSTTATMGSGVAAVTLASASSFQDGDGICIQGAGTTNTLSTPGAPTVTPSLAASGLGTGLTVAAPAGASSNQYVIIAGLQMGGYTAASATGSTATANTLGARSQAGATLARSGNTVTVTSVAAASLTAGAIVAIVGASDASFTGYFQVASSDGVTTFTYLQGEDSTRGGEGSGTSATGATIHWWSCNHISWTPVANAWIYYVYGRTAGGPGTHTYLGATLPTSPSGGVVTSSFDDYGSTIMGNVGRPWWIPSTDPSSATNNMLATTILSGGGTVNLTLAAASSNAVTATTAMFDNAPCILAAAQASIAAGNTGCVYIPVSGSNNFFVSSYLTMPDYITIRQSGRLWLDNTIQVGNAIRWYSDIDTGGIPQASFGMTAGAPITVGAIAPAIYGDNKEAFTFKGLYINQGFGYNASLLALFDSVTTILFEGNTFLTSGDGNDYLGMAVGLRGPGGATVPHRFINNEFLCGSIATYSSIAPLVYMTTTTAVASTWNRNFIGPRGIVINGGFGLTMENTYSQGTLTPLVAVVATSTIYNTIIKDTTLDTSATPILAAWGSNPLEGSILIEGILNSSGGTIVTGQPIPALRVRGVANLNASSTSNLIGQNTNVFYDGLDSIAIPPFAGPNSVHNTNVEGKAGPVHFPAGHNLFWDLTKPTNVVGVAAGGGSLVQAASPFSVAVAAIGPDGYSTSMTIGTTGIVLSGGNQTINVTWTEVVGATGYNVYLGTNGNPQPDQIFGSNVQATSFSISGGSALGSGSPLANSTGLPSITPLGVFSQKLTMQGTNVSGISYPAVYTLPALTAAYALTMPLRCMVTSTYTNATTTPSDITGLSFPVAANTTYVMRFDLYWQGSAATAGLDIKVTGPAAPTNVFYSYDQDSTGTSLTNAVASAFGTLLQGNATVTATTNLHAVITLGLINGANAGTVQVQGAAQGAGTVTVQKCSYGVMQ